MVSINAITSFLSKTEGKLVIQLFVLSFLFSQSSCTLYEYTGITKKQLTDSKRFQKNTEKYNLFVHQQEGKVYRLNDVSLGENDVIKGSGVLCTESIELPDSTWTKKEKRKYFKEHKYDIHFYTKGDALLEASLSKNLGVYSEQTNIQRVDVELSDRNIQSIYITAVDSYTTASNSVTILLVALAVVVVIGLTTLFIFASNASSQNSQGSTQSNSNSGSSNQGQGSSGSSNNSSGSSNNSGGSSGS